MAPGANIKRTNKVIENSSNRTGKSVALNGSNPGFSRHDIEQKEYYKAAHDSLAGARLYQASRPRDHARKSVLSRREGFEVSIKSSAPARCLATVFDEVNCLSRSEGRSHEQSDKNASCGRRTAGSLADVAGEPGSSAAPGRSFGLLSHQPEYVPPAASILFAQSRRTDTSDTSHFTTPEVSRRSADRSRMVTKIGNAEMVFVFMKSHIAAPMVSACRRKEQRLLS